MKAPSGHEVYLTLAVNPLIVRTLRGLHWRHIFRVHFKIIVSMHRKDIGTNQHAYKITYGTWSCTVEVGDPSCPTAFYIHGYVRSSQS